MNYTEQGYVDLIANGIDCGIFQVNFENISKDELMKLCRKHRTVGLTYAGMKKLNNTPKEYLDLFLMGMNMEVFEYVNHKELVSKVSGILNQSSIKHLILKGNTIARYYPQEELRRAGDIDILISKNDREKVKNILTELKSKYFFEQSDENVDYYKIGKTPIEVHSKIVSGVRFSNDDIYDDFSKQAYDSAIKVSDYAYEMNPVYTYVYSVFHAAKHFYKGGCGIRMVADLWLMNQAMDEQTLNQANIMLEKMKLKSFLEKLLLVAKKWFVNKNLDAKDFETIENYIITGGLFGYGNVSGDTDKIIKNKKNNYFVGVLKWAFPSYNYMRNHNEWFKDKPIFLLPVAYIKRYIKKMKSVGSKRLVNNIVKGKKETEIHSAMLQLMELNNE